MSTAMNVVPIPQEGIITASLMVNGAVMFGRGKTQCGILIEPRSGHEPGEHETSLPEFRNKIWYVVVRCYPVLYINC